MDKRTDIVERESDRVAQPPAQRSPGTAEELPALAARGLIRLSHWLVRHPRVLLAVAAVLVLVVLYMALETIVFLALVALIAAAFIYVAMRFGVHRPSS